MNVFLINKNVRDLAPEVMDSNGQLRILPAAYWATTTKEERCAFGVRNGIYSLPTVELVEHLRNMIGDRKAIEIGSGNGALAKALGIPATDNHMQESALIRSLYHMAGQQPVQYGANVERIDAHAAIAKHRPAVVVAAWVTHRSDPNDDDSGGNPLGPDEAQILQEVEEYILIGHDAVHKQKPLWRLPHIIEWHPFIYSRAMSEGRDFIASWAGAQYTGEPHERRR